MLNEPEGDPWFKKKTASGFGQSKQEKQMEMCRRSRKKTIMHLIVLNSCRCEDHKELICELANNKCTWLSPPRSIFIICTFLWPVSVNLWWPLKLWLEVKWESTVCLWLLHWCRKKPPDLNLLLHCLRRSQPRVLHKFSLFCWLHFPFTWHLVIEAVINRLLCTSQAAERLVSEAWMGARGESVCVCWEAEKV